MAGTVTVPTEEHNAPLQKIVFSWTSSAGGAADGTTSYGYSGLLERVLIVPGATTPSDQFDVVLLDDDSRDLLYGVGANCSNADTTVIEDAGIIANDKITLGVTNAGNAKNGTVVVFVR
jgi:hypothetical protein